MRWCTTLLKIKPLEEWIGDEDVVSYVAIRADESNRKGYISTKPNIRTEFPFIDDGVDHAGVVRILEESGLNLPDYYEWRTRSGCYFCFFQRKAEWVGLADHHPELFERAVAIEKKILKDAGVDGDASFKDNAMEGGNYTWSPGETLPQLLKRRKEILHNHSERLKKSFATRKNRPLVDILAESLDNENSDTGCTLCHV